MRNKITKEKLHEYRELTNNALKIAKESVINGKKKEAGEIMNMVSNYLSDSEYFEKKKDFIRAFAAVNYAHGWLDSGVRLGVFDVKDDRLFTVR